MGRAGGYLHCCASQPVSSQEIFPIMSRESPPLAGFLPQAESLCVPNLIFNLVTVQKVSADIRRCGRFLEKRAGDWVRLHCVTALPVKTVLSVRIPPPPPPS